VPTVSIHLRDASPGLLALPWHQPLGAWTDDVAAFRRVAVGPSRHLVRFLEADGVLYALKELPQRVARKEYRVLRELEARELPAVRAAGLVEQEDSGNAVLLTRFLAHAWQYRRLFERLPGRSTHRDRLLDAMAGLLVDLHRAGVFWGDCSLANTLFCRDGQLLQASLVDAETSEIHPGLSDGQRRLDLGILVENVAGDLADLAAGLGRDTSAIDEEIAAADSVAQRYQLLWDELHREVSFASGEYYKVEKHARRLNELGFAIDELHLEPAGDHGSRVRLKVCVANRRFHATELRRLTGLDVGEGQATMLLNDLRGYQCRLQGERPGSAPDKIAGSRWLAEVFWPAATAAARALGPGADPVQAYCDLLEVRWLLSEAAGRDVGDATALQTLAAQRPPQDSAAELAVAEPTTGNFPAVR
jgi:Domain of unknown function (DUF4032)/Lipopolysaccharide kinase (Kdo/WaaP) family